MTIENKVAFAVLRLMTSSQTAAYRNRQRHYRAEVRRGGPGRLNSDMQQMVRQRLSTHAYPREIEFITARPKTPSGKIQRFILRGGA